eukprot:1160252-Pelagomonas_calceolata.AAC.3
MQGQQLLKVAGNAAPFWAQVMGVSMSEPPGLVLAILEQAGNAGNGEGGAKGGGGWLPCLQPSFFRERANSLGLTAALIALDEEEEAGDGSAGAVVREECSIFQCCEGGNPATICGQRHVFLYPSKRSTGST